MKSKKPKSFQSHVAYTKNASGDSHSSFESMGMGDYYGRGVKNKMGKVIKGSGVNQVSKKGLKKPPTSLA